jgi:molecular chaperone GrpE
MTPDPEEDEILESPEAPAGAPELDPQTLRAKAAERDEFLDRLQRTMAEFQNYRNRIGREKSDLRKFVIAEVLRAVLPALDNLERAVESRTAKKDDPLLAGVRLVIEQFQRGLDQLGVKPIETEGAKFDPAQMEAVAMIETDEAEENTALEVYEKGYRLDDFVIRPARVTVATPKKPD